MNNAADSTTSFREVPCLPFVPVKFVTEDVEENTNYKSVFKKGTGNIDGLEAQKFYENVITLPSTTSPRNRKAKVVRKTKCEQNTKVSNINSSKFLLYAQEGNVKELENCLKMGIDINAKDNFGWTALMCAVCASQFEAVNFLVRYGCNSNICNSQGNTVLDIAEQQNISSDIINLLNPRKGNTEIMKFLQEPKVEKKLKKYCETCKKDYTDTKQKHDSSIAHLFNSDKPSTSSTYYHIPECNRGFQIMLKDGWDKNKGLGPSGQGLKFPVKTVLKHDRSCIGRNKNPKPRITHFGPNDVKSVKNRYENSSRLVILQERTLKKREREKIERQNRRKEINFRRQFNVD